MFFVKLIFLLQKQKVHIMRNSVSVVIPTHNRPEGLALSLKSIVEQSLFPAEVIVVDDGSVPAIKNSIFVDFPATVKCVLLRNEQPKGGNNARNRGITAATSEFIAFLDDDDQFKKNKVGIVTEAIKENPTVELFYHPAHIHMVKEKIKYYSKPYQFKLHDDKLRLLLVSNCIGGTPMTIVRRQSLIDVGLFDEEMPALQDYELWLRLAKNGCSFRFLDKPLTNYYHTSKKSSVSKSLSINARAVNLIEKKYSAEYEMLSKLEIKAHACWKKKMIIHKSLLNGDLALAIKCQFQLFVLSPSVINVASFFVMLFGPKAVFKLKAKLG